MYAIRSYYVRTTAVHNAGQFGNLNGLGQGGQAGLLGEGKNDPPKILGTRHRNPGLFTEPRSVRNNFV